MVLKQDKCRGVIVRNIQIGSKKYKGKYLNLLYPDNFIQLENDPTKTIEREIQRSIRKIKNKLTEQEYRGLYQTGSSLEKFYSTAKQIEGRNDRFI